VRSGFRAFVVLLLIFGCAVGGGSASAADETATNGFQMSPIKGGLFKEAPRAINWRVEVEVKAPYPASPQVLPMKRVTAEFPTEMSFNPDPEMPVCGDEKVGPTVNLSISPDEVISRCPESVLGNGTAELYLARVNGANGPNLKDPVLIVFNGGRTDAGLPKIKIYGYSQSVANGIYMEGVLTKEGVLDVRIPILPFDSAVGAFNLNIPGSDSPHKNRRGQTLNYVRTTCRYGVWSGGSRFILGTRNDAGDPTSPDVEVSAPPLTIPCDGATGRPRLKVGVKGPSVVKTRPRSVYRVTVRNTGTATARAIRIGASGRGASGKAKGASLVPGRSKTYKVKVRFRKRGKVKVRFKAVGKPSVTGAVVKKVRVR
jgi:hypothetical protein